MQVISLENIQLKNDHILIKILNIVKSQYKNRSSFIIDQFTLLLMLTTQG